MTSYPANYQLTYTAAPFTPGYQESDHKCEWSFADGSQSLGVSVYKTWTVVGTYGATVTATNLVTGQQATASKEVKIAPFYWGVFSPLPTLIDYPLSASLPDGTALCMGGKIGTGVYSNRTFKLNTDGTWIELASMNVAKSSFNMLHPVTCPVMNDGRVFVCGADISGNLSVEIYDPSLNTWTNVATFPPPYTNQPYIHCIKLTDGNILVGDSRVYKPLTNEFKNIDGVKGWAQSSHTPGTTDFIEGTYTNIHNGPPSKPFRLNDGRVCILLPSVYSMPSAWGVLPNGSSDFYGYHRKRIFVLNPNYDSMSQDQWSCIAKTSEVIPGGIDDGPLEIDFNLNTIGVQATDGNIYLLGAIRNSSNEYKRSLKCVLTQTGMSDLEFIQDCPFVLDNIGEVVKYGHLIMTIGVAYGSVCYDTNSHSWFGSSYPFAQQAAPNYLYSNPTHFGYVVVNNKPLILGSSYQYAPYTSTEMFYGELT